MKKVNPSAVADKFVKGFWIDMLAEEFETSEANIQAQLMERIRYLNTKIRMLEQKLNPAT